MSDRFAYEAIDGKGAIRRDTIEASDVSEAIEQLSGKGLKVVSIQAIQVQEPIDAQPTESFADQPQGQLTVHLAAAIEHKQSWLDPLKAVFQEPLSPLISKQVRRWIDQLNVAKDANDVLLSSSLLSLIGSTRNADGTCNIQRLSTAITNIAEEKRQLRQRSLALLYPLILVAFVLTIFVLYLIFVIPDFQEMFGEFGLKFPEATRFVFSLSDQLRFRPVLSLGFAVLSVALAMAIFKAWHWFGLGDRLFHFVLSGNSYRLKQMSAICLRLAQLMQAGATAPEALLLTSRSLSNRYYSVALEDLASKLASRDGSKTHIWRRRLPALLSWTLTADISNTSRSALVSELATIYGERANPRIDSFGYMLPLVVPILLGFVIVILFLLLFSPLVLMITDLS